MVVKSEEAHPYSLGEGKELVQQARHVVETITTSPRFSKKMAQEQLYRFTQRHGLFVTIEFYPTGVPRGSMGFITPIAPVGQLLVEAAIAAATEDQRYVSVTHHELDSLIFEVSILTEPKQIKAKTSSGISKQIKIGRDGLMVQYGYRSGLILPNVAVEKGWNAETSLNNLCVNAGLAEHTWRVHGVSIFKFSTQVFREKEPRGEIEEVAPR